MTLFYPYGYISCLVVSTPLKNMKVRLDHHPNYWGKNTCSWDGYSQYMESHKNHVPNHQTRHRHFLLPGYLRQPWFHSSRGSAEKATQRNSGGVGLGPREGLPLPETATARTAEKPWGTWQFHPDNMGNIYENMDNNNMAVSRYKWGFKMI